MNIQTEGEIIEILDDDDDPTASRDEGGPADEPSSSRKRKVEEDVSEKVHWTDESDSVPVKPKKRKSKRKSAGKNEKKAEGRSRGHGADDEPYIGDLPDYLQARRRDFDANKRRHHEAALMLPPDYTDIDFDETRRLADLKERPDFDARSGIKPSRPYKDIELPQSAGLIPASIAQYLRDYQVVGVKFLHRKFVYQEGGILGDDMGLGKTVQVAAFLAAAFGKTGDERDDKRMREVRFCSGRWYPRILVICPGSLIMNWRNELTRWGWWHIDIFHGSNKDDVLGTARSGLLEVMITTYDTYKNNRSSVNMVQWDAVIADECHRLKDISSETTKAMQEVNALCRIGLTGTAIQNKYEELWTLLDWTNPGHFGTRSEWLQTISKPLTVGQSHEATVAQLSLARQTARKLVQNLLPRYFLRRMKSLIADQLPRKTDRVVFCPLTDLQREAYENFINSQDIELLRTISDTCSHGNKKGWCCKTHLKDGKTPWQAIIFPSMITLQKLANHLTMLVPFTTDLDPKHDKELRTLQTCMPNTWKPMYEQRDQIANLVNPEFCGKWKVLKKLLRFWHQNGDKVLVFSHSVRLLRILQHLFSSTSYNVSYLDGSLGYEERQDVVDTFNSDPTQFVFLISTKAGGVGLNITSANKVVVVDPHWNPSYDLQAQDRAYRIGQTREVEVFRLVSLSTVEEIVYARQVYKQQQANIGYTASSERRYFRGVQQDVDRTGEIFGLKNMFTFHTEFGLLRDIVNKTNIAEAKAGVNLADVDMERAAKDEESLGMTKKEDTDTDVEDGGMSQLAAFLTTESQQQHESNSRKPVTAKSDAIQAILTSVGVEYTHDNSEVIGTSKVEEQLSRQAVMRSYADGDREGQHTLFPDSQYEVDSSTLHRTFRPPEDVCLRQFCSMAREFGFVNATEFALLVEGWTQEARRNCLDTFYRRRQAALANSESHEMERLADETIEKEEDAKDGAVPEYQPSPRSKAESMDEWKVKVEDSKKANLKVEDMKTEEVKAEPVKSEDSKVKSEDVKLDSVKDEGVKPECVKDEVVTKTDACNEDDDWKPKGFKLEEGKSKRSSIFISDDDDGDEL